MALESRVSRPLRAALVGCGRIAGGLEADSRREHPCTHAGMYRSSSRVQMISCAGQEESSVRTFQKTWGIARGYTDYRKMLESEAIDILSVCTPATEHAAITCAAARAGVKVVFCEKAMATSLKEARAMIRNCRRHGTVLCVNYGRRFGWDYHAVKALITEGKIGRLESASACFSGQLMHTGTHLFDILRYLFGEVRSVRGRTPPPGKNPGLRHKPSASGVPSGNYPDPDVLGTLFFKDGFPVHIAGMSKGYFIFEIDILGSHGRIRIGNHLHEWYIPAPSVHYSGFTTLVRAPFPSPPAQTNPWVYALLDLLQSAETGAETQASGHSAMKAMEIGFALQASSARRSALVTLPLKRCRLVIPSH